MNDSDSPASERFRGGSDGDERLTANRAFVVQFPASAHRDLRMRGRVEHVVTGRSARFGSMAELHAFFEETLLSTGREGAPSKPWLDEPQPPPMS